MEKDPYILIISKRKQGENLIKDLAGQKYPKVVERSKTHISLEDGTYIHTKPARAGALRGLHPDIVVVKQDVDEEFYKEIIVPMSSHGIVINGFGC